MLERVLCNAALNGDIELVKNCKEQGATNFNKALKFAASNGHVEIVKLCKEY